MPEIHFPGPLEPSRSVHRKILVPIARIPSTNPPISRPNFATRRAPPRNFKHGHVRGDALAKTAFPRWKSNFDFRVGTLGAFCANRSQLKSSLSKHIARPVFAVAACGQVPCLLVLCYGSCGGLWARDLLIDRSDFSDRPEKFSVNRPGEPQRRRNSSLSPDPSQPRSCESGTEN